MARKLAVGRLAVGVKGIDISEMRCGALELLAVDDQMAIVSDAHVFAAHGHHPFDVKVAANARISNTFGFEDDDLTAFGPAKVVSHTVYEKMVATDHFKFNDVLAPGVDFWGDQPGIREAGTRPQIIRWKPNPSGAGVADLEALVEIKKQKPLGDEINGPELPS